MSLAAVAGGVSVGLKIGKKLFGNKTRGIGGDVKCTTFMTEDEQGELQAFMISSKDRFELMQEATRKILNMQKRNQAEVDSAVSSPENISRVWFRNVNGSSDCKHGGGTEKEMLRVWQSGLRNQVKSFVSNFKKKQGFNVLTSKQVSERGKVISPKQISQQSPQQSLQKNILMFAIAGLAIFMILK